MPRGKKKEEANGSQDQKQKKRTTRKEKLVDPYELLDEYWKDVVSALGLDLLGLSDEEFKELIKEPFVSAVGEVKTKPKVSTIIGRLNANREALFSVLAAKLTTMKEVEKMSDTQLEFVVYYIREAIRGLGPKLYEECVKRNRNDLIDILRTKWSEFGINSPVKCPRCGFQAVMPDYVCYICKYQVPEREVKKQIGMPEVLKEYAQLDPEGFKEILSSGHFYYTWSGIIPPSKVKQITGELIFEITLSKADKEALKDLSTSGKPRPQ